MTPIRAYMLIADGEPSLEDIRATQEEIEDIGGVEWWLNHGARIVEIEIRELERAK